MSVRAKMKLASVTAHHYGSNSKTLRFQCEYDPSLPEDQRFAKATPSGHIEMQVDNPAALEQFELGKSYNVDFTPCDDVA